jgi:hypothetical protein
MYARVQAIGDGALTLFKFQQMADSRIEIHIDDWHDSLSSNYQPISENEFCVAWLALTKKIRAIDVLGTGRKAGSDDFEPITPE